MSSVDLVVDGETPSPWDVVAFEHLEVKANHCIYLNGSSDPEAEAVSAMLSCEKSTVSAQGMIHASTHRFPRFGLILASNLKRM